MSFASRIFLSPHPDDVAYSCYGSIVNSPKPRLSADLILTVFSVSVRAKGELGKRMCQEEITSIRQAEDDKFARSEGCRLLRLHLPDSSVRGELNRGSPIASEDSSLHPIFKSVKDSIEKVIRPALGLASIYVPLGIGSHIDHRMVRDATTIIARESKVAGALDSLIYYEDLPYAHFTESHEIPRLAEKVIPSAMRSYTVSLQNLWGRKKKAAQMYASQITPVVLKALADHSSCICDSEHGQAERLWTSDPLPIGTTHGIVTWIAWEAAQRIGHTILLNQVLADPTFRTTFDRKMVLGPVVARSPGGKLESLDDIQEHAGRKSTVVAIKP